MTLFEMWLRQKFFNKGLKGEDNTPLIVSYAVTNACNLNCSHCHINARSALKDELDLFEAMRVITELAALGTKVIIFSGGEPLLRKDFVLALAEYSVDEGIIPAILTNGVLLDREVALELKNSGITAVGLPLDSIDPLNHDRLRNMSGSFQKAVNAINSCLDVDLEVVITTMALKNTFNDIPQRIDYMLHLGVSQVAVYDLIPVGRGRKVMDEAMNNEQRIELIRYLQREQEKSKMVFTMSGGQPLYPEIVSKIHQTRGTKPSDLLLKHFWINNPIGCHAGILYFSLRPNGDVYPCAFLPIKAGNIREENLTQIWTKSKILKNLRQRNNLKGICGTCDFRETCGGCRARAYACSGDYLASDPVCLRDLLLDEKISPNSMKRFGWCVG